MLAGFIDLVIRSRVLVPVLAGDPGAIEILRSHTEVSDLVERQFKLLADIEPGVGGWIKADVTMSGIACGMGVRARELDESDIAMIG